MLDVQNIDALTRYAQHVAVRIGHHASDVSFAFPAVIGHVILYGSKFSLLGDGTKNAAWFISRASGKRYALSYGHPTILIRDGTFRGPVVASIDNDTTPAEYGRIFRSL